jgi:hypothetical protein
MIPFRQTCHFTGSQCYTILSTPHPTAIQSILDETNANFSTAEALQEVLESLSQEEQRIYAVEFATVEDSKIEEEDIIRSVVGTLHTQLFRNDDTYRQHVQEHPEITRFYDDVTVRATAAMKRQKKWETFMLTKWGENWLKQVTRGWLLFTLLIISFYLLYYFTYYGIGGTWSINLTTQMRQLLKRATNNPHGSAIIFSTFVEKYMPIRKETKELAWVRPDQIQPGVVKRALAEYQQVSGAVISDTPTPKRM